jgi:hypothetical protein
MVCDASPSRLNSTVQSICFCGQRRVLGCRPSKYNKRRAEDQMVVAAYEGGRWLILDNGTMTLVTDVDASAVYSPLFVLDDTGTRRYVLPAS